MGIAPPFDVLIDETFINCHPSSGLTPVERKNVFSLMNGFEDNDWWYRNFHRFIWDNIGETALSASERENLIGQAQSELGEAAKKLRLSDKDTGSGSEIAEIILYGIMRHHYKALPVVPKIFYKQNANDYAKGADSVHIVIDDKRSEFTIWFGEAKFYDSIENARLAKIVESVEESLKPNKLKKESSIITGLRDLDALVTDAKLNGQIRDALSHKTSLDTLKPILHVPILLLYECKLTSSTKVDSATYRSSIIEYHKERALHYFSKQLDQLKDKVSLYEKITFHVILLPVPDKKKIVENFLRNAVHHKDS